MNDWLGIGLGEARHWPIMTILYNLSINYSWLDYYPLNRFVFDQ